MKWEITEAFILEAGKKNKEYELQYNNHVRILACSLYNATDDPKELEMLFTIGHSYLVCDLSF